MTVASDARLSSLDRMLDDSQVGETFATDMFGVVDALDSSANAPAGRDRSRHAGRSAPGLGAWVARRQS